MRIFGYKNKIGSPVVNEVISWTKTILFAIIFALCINNFIMVNASVPTGSMENTIMPDDRIMAFRLAYTFSDPERLDIIVFRYPDDENTLFVKRIIGMPGDKVDIKDGKVYINDSPEPLDDSFVKEQPRGSFGPYLVPQNHYFMMGDNRNSSKDSREWKNTFLRRDKILGKVIFKYFPSFEFLAK